MKSSDATDRPMILIINRARLKQPPRDSLHQRTAPTRFVNPVAFVVGDFPDIKQNVTESHLAYDILRATATVNLSWMAILFFIDSPA